MMSMRAQQGGRTVIPRVWVASTFWERALGLIGRRGLPEGAALYFPGCRCIHTGWMRFAIDVRFLDQDGCTVRMVRNLGPWRMAWGGWRAAGVLETAAGTGRTRPEIDASQPLSLVDHEP